MRRIGAVVLFALLLGTFVYVGAGQAHCGCCGFHQAKAGEVVNTVCPVMGGKISKDTPHRVEYQGKTIGFCCADCIKAFNADPEKYMAKLKAPGKCMIKCPKCGAEIDVAKECQKLGKPCALEEKETAGDAKDVKEPAE